MRQVIQDLTEYLLDRVVELGRMDRVRDYSVPIPTTMIDST
jgi:hypothetical protein